MSALRLILIEVALRECEDYFEQRADAEIDHTGTTGNEEMRLLVEIRQALECRA